MVAGGAHDEIPISDLRYLTKRTINDVFYLSKVIPSHKKEFCVVYLIQMVSPQLRTSRVYSIQNSTY